MKNSLLIILIFLVYSSYAQNNVFPSSGNVGIGATSPTFHLDIFTNNYYQGVQLYNNNGNWSRLFSRLQLKGYNDISKENDAGIIFGTFGGINTVSNGFVIAPHRGLASGIRIDNIGNVGIGTSNPDFMLTVNGKIKAEEVQVVVDVPADYVFEPTYNLMPLSEVARYIKLNKHLPNIPSANELTEKGWAVGEMNNKLLEKIEELTLYVLELKRENEELKERMNRIETITNNK